MARNTKPTPAPVAKVRNVTAKLGRGNCTRGERRAKLEAAIRKVFTKSGYSALTRHIVAAAADCSAGMVNNHFGSAGEMRAWAADDAVSRKDTKTLRKMHADGFVLPKMPKTMQAECTK